MEKSFDELQKEINLLQEKLKDAKKREIPKPLTLEQMKFKDLINLTEEHIKNISEKGFDDEDAKHYIFEKVMTTVYGPDIWKWYNKNNKG